MDFKTKIVHWNCRGLKPNYNEILLLLSLLKPSVFCLQETFLKQEDNINFKGFNLYNYIYTAGQKPSGGSSILVHSSYPQREIKLSTDLQAVAVSVSLEKEITICSLYIPPNFTLHSQHLNSLLEQLPSPYLLVGDFNGHNMLCFKLSHFCQLVCTVGYRVCVISCYCSFQWMFLKHYRHIVDILKVCMWTFGGARIDYDRITAF